MAQETDYYVIKQIIHCYAMNKHATIEELLETVFSVRYDPMLYNENQRDKLLSSVCMNQEIEIIS
jgi:hypothetical protein